MVRHFRRMLTARVLGMVRPTSADPQVAAYAAVVRFGVAGTEAGPATAERLLKANVAIGSESARSGATAKRMQRR